MQTCYLKQLAARIAASTVSQTVLDQAVREVADFDNKNAELNRIAFQLERFSTQHSLDRCQTLKDLDNRQRLLADPAAATIVWQVYDAARMCGAEIKDFWKLVLRRVADPERFESHTTAESDGDKYKAKKEAEQASARRRHHQDLAARSPKDELFRFYKWRYLDGSVSKFGQHQQLAQDADSVRIAKHPDYPDDTLAHARDVQRFLQDGETGGPEGAEGGDADQDSPAATLSASSVSPAQSQSPTLRSSTFHAFEHVKIPLRGTQTIFLTRNGANKFLQRCEDTAPSRAKWLALQYLVNDDDVLAGGDAPPVQVERRTPSPVPRAPAKLKAPAASSRRRIAASSSQSGQSKADKVAELAERASSRDLAMLVWSRKDDAVARVPDDEQARKERDEIRLFVHPDAPDRLLFHGQDVVRCLLGGSAKELRSTHFKKLEATGEAVKIPVAGVPAWFITEEPVEDFVAASRLAHAKLVAPQRLLGQVAAWWRARAGGSKMRTKSKPRPEQDDTVHSQGVVSDAESPADQDDEEADDIDQDDSDRDLADPDPSSDEEERPRVVAKRRR